MSKVTLPTSLQQKFDAIHREVVILNFKWVYFRQLFGQQKTIDVLNQAAPSAFHLIEAAMFIDILLSIMRLVDPKKSSGQPNLSFGSINEELPDGNIRDAIFALQEQIRLRTEDMKVWRNKKLAHNDLSRHLPEATTLPSIQYKDLFEAMRLIGQLMNVLHKNLSDTEFQYDRCITRDDGYKLLFYLKYGFDAAAEDLKESKMTRRKMIRGLLGNPIT
jgi:hypothetical protein